MNRQHFTIFLPSDILCFYVQVSVLHIAVQKMRNEVALRVLHQFQALKSLGKNNLILLHDQLPSFCQ